LRLFRSALKAAGVAAPGESPPPKARLTGGQGPRFLGVFQHGPKVHALDRVAKISERFDIFGEIAAVAASRDGSLSDESVADQIERTVSKWKSLPIVSDDQPDVGG
jgi:hypothetical protein